MVKDSDMKVLAMLIEDEVKKEFGIVHLSENLKRTIRIEKNSLNGYNVIIAAPMYDINEWKRSGARIRKPGSYASAVDKTGGFSGSHKGYIEKCINKAIDRWLALKSSDYKLVRRM